MNSALFINYLSDLAQIKMGPHDKQQPTIKKKELCLVPPNKNYKVTHIKLLPNLDPPLLWKSVNI